MEPERTANPYAFTEAAAGTEEISSGSRMPTPLVVLAILLLLMGGAGIVLNGFASVVLAVQAVAMTAQPPSGGNDPQEELQRQIEANNARLMPFTCGSLVANFLLSIPMIVGAIGLFLRREWARVLTLRTIYANAIFFVLEVPFGAVALYLQYSSMIGLMEAASPTGPLGEANRTFIYAIVVMQIVVMVLLYGYELGVYWFGASYLRRDHVKAIFS